MGLFKQKTLWLGIVAKLIVLMVFGLAMMGSIIGSKPKELPIALVVADQPAKLPNGETLAIGTMVREKLLSNPQLPVKWKIVSSEEKVREGLNEQEYYGALVLPADLSAGVLSLQSPAPQPGVVKIIVNEGMNAQAAAAVKQILQQAMRGVSLELSKQVLGMISAQSKQMPVVAAQALLTPIQVQEETVHPVGANNASGNAPGILTQIMWIGSLVVSMFLFLTVKKAVAIGVRKGEAILTQTVVGIVLEGLVSGFLVWMASSWYGMELVNAGSLWMFMWLTGSAFFLLQSSLINWLGFPAMGILVLLMFFSMPLLNMAPEFLPQVTQDWLYSWTPLRFAASGLRNAMYFDGVVPSATNATVLWSISGGFLVLLFASALRRSKPKMSASTVSAH
jgi:YhgE/Pip-like protein